MQALQWAVGCGRAVVGGTEATHSTSRLERLERLLPVSRVAEETQPQGVQRLRVRGIVVLSGQQGVVGVLEGTLLHVGPQFWVWPLRDSGAETVLVDVWRVSNPKTNTRRTPSAGVKQDDKRA